MLLAAAKPEIIKLERNKASCFQKIFFEKYKNEQLLLPRQEKKQND